MRKVSVKRSCRRSSGRVTIRSGFTRIQPINTVKQPSAIVSSGPTHVHMSVTRAAGSSPIKTVIAAGGKMGPPTCGMMPSTIGQTCISVTRDAGIPPMRTVGIPRMIAPPCAVRSPIRAAGSPPPTDGALTGAGGGGGPAVFWYSVLAFWYAATSSGVAFGPGGFGAAA